jgi:hypothetical protein
MDYVTILTDFAPKRLGKAYKRLTIDGYSAKPGQCKRWASRVVINDDKPFRACPCGLSGLNAWFIIITVTGKTYVFPYLLPHYLSVHRKEALKYCPQLLQLIDEALSGVVVWLAEQPVISLTAA